MFTIHLKKHDFKLCMVRRYFLKIKIMARDLNSFPLSECIRSKLVDSGFTSSDHFEGIGPIELSKETALTPEEAVNVLETIHHANAAGVEICNVTALNLFLEEKSKAPIPTFCKNLDKILGGGIAPGKITEICGSPGAGKTQLCLQLCTNVQIPLLCGGVEGEAIYIDTEGSLCFERLNQIAEHTVSLSQKIIKCTNPSASIDAFSTDSVLRGVHYFHCTNYLELLSFVNVLEDFLQLHPKVQLIIVDSISFHFRFGFEKPYSVRNRLLNELSQNLVRIAKNSNLFVIVTNQMTTNEINSVIPALGESWGHACSVRLILSWEGEYRRAVLFKSPWNKEDSAKYQITASGVRDCVHNIATTEQYKAPDGNQPYSKRPKFS